MFLRAIKIVALALLTMGFLGLGGSNLQLNPAQRVAFGHAYSLVKWEVINLPSKWVHRVVTALPWISISSTERRSRTEEYFQLGEQLASLQGGLAQVAATDGGTSGDVAGLGIRIAGVESERLRLRNDVEEELEAVISAVLSDHGFSSWLGTIFPPVDIRLDEPPKLLVTSPRDRIVRTHDVLLDPAVTIEQSEEMEEALREKWDLSSLVQGIGGVATYPASVVDTQPLHETLRLTSHEWLHHYLFFRPLGFNIFSSPEMLTLNETLANMFGGEVGDQAFVALGGAVVPPPADQQPAGELRAANGDSFDYNLEMRKTRQRVDRLLADGEIEAAESYMEERRKLFVENGYRIRKINQAFFAFHGTYADSPTSVSPIAGQLEEYRALMPDLGTFVSTMSKVSSYPQFLELLERLKASAS